MSRGCIWSFSRLIVAQKNKLDYVAVCVLQLGLNSIGTYALDQGSEMFECFYCTKVDFENYRPGRSLMVAAPHIR